jgi:hypothetical protein
MRFKKFTPHWIISFCLFFNISYAEVLSSSGFLYGQVGSERGDIVKQIPGAIPAYRVHCSEKSECKKVISGYLIKRTPALDSGMKAELEKLVTKESGLHGAVDTASTAIGQDIASTALGLANGATELNPLLGASPSGLALLAVGLLRHKAVEAQANDTSVSFETRARNVCLSAGLSQGAAANNIALLATGAGALPVIIGMVVGQARMSSCIAAAHEAQNLIIHRENMALQAYADSLKAMPNDEPNHAVAGVRVIQTASL